MTPPTPAEPTAAYWRLFRFVALSTAVAWVVFAACLTSPWAFADYDPEVRDCFLTLAGLFAQITAPAVAMYYPPVAVRLAAWESGLGRAVAGVVARQFRP